MQNPDSPDSQDAPLNVTHGAKRLPSVIVEAYSADMRDEKGYFGERASNTAFRALIEEIRSDLAARDADPLDDPMDDLTRKRLDKILLKGEPLKAGVILSAIEGFAQNMVGVVEQLLNLRQWGAVRDIVVGGGFRQSRVGELAIGRAGILLAEKGHDIVLRPIRFHPDEAGLLGCVHLAPAWMFGGHDCILAVDIGGSNFRVGIVAPNLKKARSLARATVIRSKLWRHADEQPDRHAATQTLGEMLREMIEFAANEGLKLAPFIGIGCPGTVLEDGRLEGGVLNLPGDWSKESFHLVEEVKAMAPTISDHETMIVLHNDAVTHGLCERPFMSDMEKWGVLTIGTGLGNACFRNVSATPTND